MLGQTIRHYDLIMIDSFKDTSDILLPDDLVSQISRYTAMGEPGSGLY